MAHPWCYPRPMKGKVALLLVALAAAAPAWRSGRPSERAIFTEHTADQPQSVQDLVVDRRKVWRVGFGRRDQATGGEVVVSVDSTIGRCDIGWGPQDAHFST